MGTFDKNLTSKYLDSNLELTFIILSQVMTLKPDSELFEGQTLNWKSLDKLFDGHFYDYYGEWNLIHWPSFKTWKVVLKRIQRHCSKKTSLWESSFEYLENSILNSLDRESSVENIDDTLKSFACSHIRYMIYQSILLLRVRTFSSWLNWWQ